MRNYTNLRTATLLFALAAGLGACERNRPTPTPAQDCVPLPPPVPPVVPIATPECESDDGFIETPELAARNAAAREAAIAAKKGEPSSIQGGQCCYYRCTYNPFTGEERCRYTCFAC